MRRSISILILTLAGLSTPGRSSQLAAQSEAIGPQASLTTDTKARVVTITMGPFTIPAGGPGMHHGKMSAHETPTVYVTWPVEGWFHAYDVEVRDSTGQKLSRKFLHHLSMVNLGRRQLIYPAYERLLGASQEVDRFSAPKSIGVPMKPGMRLATFIGWHNSKPEQIRGAMVTVRMRYTPPNMMPRPLDIHLLYMDVSYTVGKSDAYNLPAGPSSKTYEFTLPVGGRIIAAGGHLHDYAKFVRLEDAESGKVLLDLTAKTDSLGKLKGVSTKLLGIKGDGLRLKAGRRYRVRADYDNPTGTVLKQGAMGLIVGAFVPDDPAKWPELDPNDPGVLTDMAMLESIGRGKQRAPAVAADSMGSMEGMNMDHDHGAVASDSAHMEHQHDQ
jgi:hypothetical protein